MEFVTGASLLEVVNAYIEHQEPMPLGLALAAARDTAIALHYAHTYVDPLGRPRRIIHRDVAPKNVMMTYDGATKLLDFGVAKSQGTGATQVGVVVGTPGYMSPEQAVGQPLDGRSDVYSLAVTLWECVTARRLFMRETAEEEIRAPLEVDPPAPSTINPRIPSGVDDLLLKALSRKRERRFATALELAKVLDAVAPELIWSADKRGDAVQRLFSRRREQTRRLLAALESDPDTTRLNFRPLEPRPEWAVTDPFIPVIPDVKKGSDTGSSSDALTTRVASTFKRALWAVLPLLAVGAVVVLAKLLPATRGSGPWHQLTAAASPVPPTVPDAGADAGTT
jgi:eukaryotic-like serine/threonine-protein kinase